MIIHLVKLLWNRKRANALLAVEIFFAFLVTCAVAVLAVHVAGNLRQPLGFDWKGVWRVSMEADEAGPMDAATWGAALSRLLDEAATLDPVEAVAGLEVVPYTFSERTAGVRHDGREPVEVQVNRATDMLAEVLDLRLVEGRWFEAADSELVWEPVVIDRDLARRLFGDDSPLGETLDGFYDGNQPRRVIGVVEDFREDGELATTGPYLFERTAGDDPEARALVVSNLLVRIRPGTPATFEAELVEHLGAVAPGWSFEAEPLSELRRTSFRVRLAPLVVGALVVFFLLLMVAMGLVGVLWQNVLQRTREIGVRRALGAAGADIHRQILMEIVIVTTLGLGLGTILLLQLPIGSLLGGLAPGVLPGGVALAMAVIYALVALCALYPSWLASRIHPAEALHHE